MKKIFELRGIERLKAIQDLYKKNPVTKILRRPASHSPWALDNPVTTVTPPKDAVLTDVFGTPLDEVSPRLQRIRDMEARKRTVPVQRTVPAYDPYPQTQMQNRVNTASQKPTESYDDWVARMKTQMDKAADYMESK